MKALSLTFLILSGLILDVDQEAPAILLHSQDLSALVYLPDVEKGHYRGQRFDWSGIVGQVWHKEKPFFGRLRDDALAHDGGSGLLEEFDLVEPYSWSRAKEGEGFVKIGVGVLKKAGIEYAFHKKYEPIEIVPWDIKVRGSSVEFIQDVSHPLCSYVYKKTIKLDDTQSSLRVIHSLTNTGNEAFSTTHYNHTMLCFNEQSIGKDYEIEFSTEPNPYQKMIMPGMIFKGKSMVFSDAILNKSYYGEVKLFKEGMPNTLSVKTQGQSMKYLVDQDVSKVAIYAEKGSLSPELFTEIHIGAGKTASWTNTYQFECDKDVATVPSNLTD